MPNTAVNATYPKKNKKRRVSKEDSIKNDSNNINPGQTATEAGTKTSSPSSPSFPGNILNLDTANLIQGILWAEILDKPVSKRRGRW